MKLRDVQRVQNSKKFVKIGPKIIKKLIKCSQKFAYFTYLVYKRLKYGQKIV